MGAYYWLSQTAWTNRTISDRPIAGQPYLTTYAFTLLQDDQRLPQTNLTRSSSFESPQEAPLRHRLKHVPEAMAGLCHIS